MRINFTLTHINHTTEDSMEGPRATILVQVQPSASQNKVGRFADGVLHLRIASPPVKGKANQELIRFLSSILGIARSNLTIEKGATSKRKVISIQGLTQEQVMGRLEERHHS